MPHVQLVADRVVLAHEERVQQREADPEVPGDAGQVDVRLELRRRQAELVDLQLAVLARAQRVGEGGVAAVDLRAVPPVRVVGDERRRLAGIACSGPRRVRWICIGCSGHGSSSASWISQGSSGSFLPWLNQSCTSNWIQAPASRLSVVAGLELVAGEQLAADQARVRLEQLVRRLAERVASSGTLRPKRLPRLPISGSSRSL